jgi:hypothetical protein
MDRFHTVVKSLEEMELPLGRLHHRTVSQHTAGVLPEQQRPQSVEGGKVNMVKEMVAMPGASLAHSLQLIAVAEHTVHVNRGVNMTALNSRRTQEAVGKTYRMQSTDRSG